MTAALLPASGAVWGVGGVDCAREDAREGGLGRGERVRERKRKREEERKGLVQLECA